MKKREDISIVEVGPRDGLQNECFFVPTKDKITFINLLISAGIKEFEITSFVSSKVIPQLSDAEVVLNSLKKHEGVVYSALIPNLSGLKRALKTELDKAVVFIATSESFNKKNLNASIKESLRNISDIKKECDFYNIPVKASVSTCFECPYEGKITPNKVEYVVAHLFSMGISDIVICDTMGVTTPLEIQLLLGHLSEKYDIRNFSLHIHNTLGIASACVYKGFEMGIRKFETSSGGLGGCPNAPGAAGNLPTEEVVYLFERMGIKTGIDLDKVVEASRFMERILNKNLTSRILCYKKSKIGL